jgi:hypothetical protein
MKLAPRWGAYRETQMFFEGFGPLSWLPLGALGGWSDTL